MDTAELHEKLDTIFADDRARERFMSQVVDIVLGILAVKKTNEETLSEEEKNRLIEKPSPTILAEYGIDYAKYRALKEGKGTTQSFLTLKRIIDRLGYTFDKILYNEELINSTYDYYEKTQAIDKDFPSKLNLGKS